MVRQDWNDNELVEQLPLSCCQSPATIAYLLEKSNFQIELKRWLPNINRFVIDTNNSKSPHYLIIASKPLVAAQQIGEI